MTCYDKYCILLLKFLVTEREKDMDEKEYIEKYNEEFGEILNVRKKDIKNDFSEIKKLAEEIGTTQESILYYIIAKKLSSIDGSLDRRLSVDIANSDDVPFMVSVEE